MHHRAPRLGIDDVGVLEGLLHPVGIADHLEARAEFPGLLLRLVHDLRHQLELRRMRQHHVHAKTRHLQNQRLRHRHRLLVRSSISPRHDHLLAAQITALLFDDRHQVGQALERVIDVALHVEHRHARRLCNRIQITVAQAPVDMANGDAIEIAAKDFADLLGGIAVRDLRRARFDERGVAAQLCHAGLKRSARARAAEEEQHRQHLVAQTSVGLIQRALALQIERHIHDGFNLFFAKVEVADEVTSVKECLHG